MRSGIALFGSVANRDTFLQDRYCGLSVFPMTNVIYYTKCLKYVLKSMGFLCRGVWGIGYWRVMGFSVKMSANQLGSPKKSWDFRGYGLPEVWFMGVSTVLRKSWGTRILGLHISQELTTANIARWLDEWVPHGLQCFAYLDLKLEYGHSSSLNPYKCPHIFLHGD